MIRRARGSRSSKAVTASDVPETTTDSGPFTAATTSSSPNDATSPCTSANGSATDTIPPRPASPSPINFDRAHTTRAASSKDNTPATHAAAISPCE